MRRSLCSLPFVLALFLAACGDSGGGAASTSASATSKPPPPPPPPPPTASATASASAGPVLPGTALKDVLKDLKSVMVLSKATGAMGAMVSDKKDIAALVAAIGLDQQLKKSFESRCMTPTKLDFESTDNKSLGVIGFCDTDSTFASGRFDGSGAQQAQIDVKDPAAFKAALKKAGAIK
jgi:hypothetical protein